jgi:hypothetical protein
MESFSTEGEVVTTDFGAHYEPPKIKWPETGWIAEVRVSQPYLIEVWIEKSTQDEFLLPLCRRYHVNLVRFTGESSATKCEELVDRVIAAGKPCRILYLSDFDPCGEGMPVSAAVKIAWFAKNHPDLDIRLEPIGLTHEQVEHFKFPRVVIKDTDVRRKEFEERYGFGGVELDAMEELYPGEMRRIVEEAILRFYDAELASEVRGANGRYVGHLNDIDVDVANEHAAEIDDIEGRIEAIKQTFDAVAIPAREKRDRVIRLAQARYERVLEGLREQIEAMEETAVADAEDLLPRMQQSIEHEIEMLDGGFEWPMPKDG